MLLHQRGVFIDEAQDEKNLFQRERKRPVRMINSDRAE